MKNLYGYKGFNEKKLFDFLKRKDKNCVGKDCDIEQNINYEDDDLFDILFYEIKKTFNINNLSWEEDVYYDFNGWKYLHNNGDEIIIYYNAITGKSGGASLLVNGTELDINPKNIDKLIQFFIKMNENKRNRKKEEIKREITGNKNITDNELADYIFDNFSSSHINIDWVEKDGFGFGFKVNIGDDISVHLINNRGDKGTPYPTNNMFINDIGFEIDINKLEKISDYLNDLSDELDKKKKIKFKKSIRDKYKK